jgi:hypothetical protein
MRIAPLGLWLLGSIFWLPWALLLLRLLADLALGTPPADSSFTAPLFFALRPHYGWRDWRVDSWFPICALLGMGMSAVAWRITWLLRDALLRRNAAQILLSVAIPPLALYFAWRDAKADHFERNLELEEAAQDARDRLAQG